MAKWNPVEWAEKTRLLSVEERGTLVDIRNMMMLRAEMEVSEKRVATATMDTWGLVLRMSAERARKAFEGLEAAGVIRTVPRPQEAVEGHNVLTVECAW